MMDATDDSLFIRINEKILKQIYCSTTTSVCRVFSFFFVSLRSGDKGSSDDSPKLPNEARWKISSTVNSTKGSLCAAHHGNSGNSMECGDNRRERMVFVR